MPPPARRTPLIGLTGAVASGKSSALEALRRLGAATLSSDAVVHELLTDEPVRELLVERWGKGVVSGGSIDRGRVAAIVFERPDELAWLEGALHPLVRERIAAWHRDLPAGTPVAAVEVPLLFETGAEEGFDATVCVTAPDDVRAERAGARGTSALAGRSARQLSQAEKAARADYAVANDGSLEQLEDRLAELMPRLARDGA